MTERNNEQLDESYTGGVGDMAPRLTPAQLSEIEQVEALAGVLHQAFVLYLSANPDGTLSASTSGAATFFLRHMEVILNFYRNDVDTFARWQAEILGLVKKIETRIAEIQPAAHQDSVAS